MNLRRDKERQQRREVLLEAAARVFGRKPFDEATMQEVAAEAEIGMQGVYEHFPSKQQLYEETMLARAEAFHRQADQVLSGGAGSPLARIAALAQVYAESFKDRPCSLPSFIRDRVQFDWGFDTRFRSRLGEIYLGERKRLQDMVQQALDQGLLRPMDPGFLAQLAMDVLEASLHYAHHQVPMEEPAACVARAMDCLLRGVGAVGGGERS
jgi:AcrR family transcriptional regulator